MKSIISIFVVALMMLLICSGVFADNGDYNKGVKYYKSADYKNAIAYLEKYVKTQPGPAAYYMLGYAYYELKNFKKSRMYFDEAYLIAPDFTSKKIPVNAGSYWKK